MCVCDVNMFVFVHMYVVVDDDNLKRVVSENCLFFIIIIIIGEILANNGNGWERERVGAPRGGEE